MRINSKYQIFTYSGLPFDLNSLTQEDKDNVKCIQKLSSSGLSFLTWKTTGQKSLKYLEDCVTYLLTSSSDTPDYDISFIPPQPSEKMFTPSGANVGIQATLQDTDIDITFNQVNSSGETTIRFLTSNPDGYGQLFNITTTSSFSGSVYVGFKMPAAISEIDFNEIIVTKESQSGTMQDVTVTSGPFARHYPSRMVYGMGNGFSNWAFASGRTTQDYSCEDGHWQCLWIRSTCACLGYSCCFPTGNPAMGTLCKTPCPPNTPYRRQTDCACTSSGSVCNTPCVNGVCPEGCNCVYGSGTPMCSSGEDLITVP